MLFRTHTTPVVHRRISLNPLLLLRSKIELHPEYLICSFLWRSYEVAKITFRLLKEEVNLYMWGILVGTVGSKGWGSIDMFLPPIAHSVHNLPQSGRGRWGREILKGQDMCIFLHPLNTQVPYQVTSNVRCMGVKISWT